MTSLARWIQGIRWMILIAILLLYFIFLPVSYSFDGTVFSQMLRYALHRHDLLGIVQIHHLLYFPLNYLTYRFLQILFNYQVLEFFHLQMFSMFFGVTTLFVVERMLKKLGLDLWLRLAGVAIIAFSHAFWLYSVDAEVHIPGVFFIITGIYLLLFRQEQTMPLTGAAFCFAVAAGFHLTNGLIIVTVFLYLLFKREPWRHFAQFFLAYAAVLLFMFGTYSLLSGKSIPGIIHAGLFGNDVYSGYHIAYAHPFAWTTALASLTSVKEALVAGSGLASALLLAGYLLLLVMGLRRSGAVVEIRFKRAMLLWTLPYLIFFSIWDPGNLEFKIHVIVPLLLVALNSLSRLKSAVAWTTGAILAIGVLSNNLFFGIKPKSEIANNTDYQTAMAIGRATPTEAQVLITGRFSGYGYGKIYIPYFAGREAVILDWLLGKGHSLPAIFAELARRSADGRPVFALDEIAVPGAALSDLLDFHGVSAGDRSRFAACCRFVPLAPLPGNRRLYRVELAAH